MWGFEVHHGQLIGSGYRNNGFIAVKPIWVYPTRVIILLVKLQIQQVGQLISRSFGGVQLEPSTW
jgi:hypothetical protein